MGTTAGRRPAAAVAVAASAGGVEALTRFMETLPEDFPAVVLVVLHLPETGPSVLPGILGRNCRLPVVQARGEVPLEPGLVVVAPPGRHLRAWDGLAVIDRGPRQNGYRPSADVLLTSVAETFGPRSAGIVLSGSMDDGAAGLRAIADMKGLTVVQDPAEAAFPGMPRAALAEVETAAVCRVGKMVSLLTDWLTRLDERDQADPAVPAVPAAPGATGEDSMSVGGLSAFTCPECGGTLWTEREFGSERYRCRVGHSFSLSSLMVGKQDAIEAALWAAIVALEERADLSRRLLKRLEPTGRPSALRRYRDSVAEATEQIELLRGVIHELVDHGILTDGMDDGDGEHGADTTA